MESVDRVLLLRLHCEEFRWLQRSDLFQQYRQRTDLAPTPDDPLVVTLTNIINSQALSARDDHDHGDPASAVSRPRPVLYRRAHPDTTAAWIRILRDVPRELLVPSTGPQLTHPRAAPAVDANDTVAAVAAAAADDDLDRGCRTTTANLAAARVRWELQRQRHQRLLLRAAVFWNVHSLPFSVLFALFRCDRPAPTPRRTARVDHTDHADPPDGTDHTHPLEHAFAAHLRGLDQAYPIAAAAVQAATGTHASKRAAAARAAVRPWSLMHLAIDHNCTLLLQALTDNHVPGWDPRKPDVHLELCRRALREHRRAVLDWACHPLRAPTQFLNLWTFDKLLAHGCAECPAPADLWTLPVSPDATARGGRPDATDLWTARPALTTTERILFLVDCIQHDNVAFLSFALGRNDAEALAWRAVVAAHEDANHLLWTRALVNKSEKCLTLLLELHRARCLPFPHHRDVLAQCLLHGDTWATQFLAEHQLYRHDAQHCDLARCVQAAAVTGIDVPDQQSHLLADLGAVLLQHEHAVRELARTRAPAQVPVGPAHDPFLANAYLVKLVAVPGGDRVVHLLEKQHLLPRFDVHTVLTAFRTPHAPDDLLRTVWNHRLTAGDFCSLAAPLFPTRDEAQAHLDTVFLDVLYLCVQHGRHDLLSFLWTDVGHRTRGGRHALRDRWGRTEELRRRGAPHVARAAARGDLAMLELVQKLQWDRWEDVDGSEAILAQQLACVRFLHRFGTPVHFSQVVALVRDVLADPVHAGTGAGAASPCAGRGRRRALAAAHPITRRPRHRGTAHEFVWPMLDHCLARLRTRHGVKSRAARHRDAGVAYLHWPRAFQQICSQDPGSQTQSALRKQRDAAIVCAWAANHLPVPHPFHAALVCTTLTQHARNLALHLFAPQIAAAEASDADPDTTASHEAHVVPTGVTHATTRDQDRDRDENSDQDSDSYATPRCGVDSDAEADLMDMIRWPIDDEDMPFQFSTEDCAWMHHDTASSASCDASSLSAATDEADMTPAAASGKSGTASTPTPSHTPTPPPLNAGEMERIFANEHELLV